MALPKLVFGVVLVAVLTLACTNDDDVEPTPTATATADPAASYEAAVSGIVSRVSGESDELTAPLGEALQNGSTMTIITRLLEVVPKGIAIEEAGIAELEALDPPAAYAEVLRATLNGGVPWSRFSIE